MDIKTLLGDAFKEGMSIEDINKALADKTFVDPSTLPESVSKELYNKASTEAANLRKQLKEKSTTEEQAAQAQKETHDRIAALEKENGQYKLEKQFLGGGYDAKTAAALAEAVAGGDMAKFATLNTAFLTAQKTSIEASVKAELLKETPGLQGGGAGGAGGGEEHGAWERMAAICNSPTGVPTPAAPEAGASK